MEANTPEAWYFNLPKITRIALTSCFATTCLVQFGLLDPFMIILDWKLVTQSYHIWRPFTAAVYLGRFSLPFLMSLYFLTSFGGKLEKSERFAGSPADYVYFLIIVILSCAVLSLLLAWPRGYPLTGQSVVFSLLYYWSRCEPEARLSLWGFEVKGYQFPFAMMAFTFLSGGEIWPDVLGLGAGHVYFFLKDVVPVEYGWDIMRTPRWFRGLFLDSRRVPGRVNPPATARVFGGPAYRLGRD